MNASTVRRMLNRRVTAIALALTLLLTATAAAPLVDLSAANHDAPLPLLACEGSQCGGGGGG